MPNPWLEIPLADYEGHMSLATIGQAQMLADQFAELLARYAPPSVAVIGCAGGNGFDRISPQHTRRVVGIDINPTYVEEVSKRYARGIPGLELYVADIQRAAPQVLPVDLIFAGLLFEYVELEPSLRALKSMCAPNGILAALLQLPSQSVPSVSPSPFASLRALEPVMRLLAPERLSAYAAQVGFVLNTSQTLILPSHKAFSLQVFRAESGLVPT